MAGLLEKREITIEVEVETAVCAIGLIRAYFPQIMELIAEKSKFVSFDSAYDFKRDNQFFKDVLDEIYEKCKAETDIVDVAKREFQRRDPVS